MLLVVEVIRELVAMAVSDGSLRVDPKPTFSISEQLFRRIVKQLGGGLVCKAHRLLNHSTPGSRVTKKEKKSFQWNGHAPASFSLER